MLLTWNFFRASFWRSLSIWKEKEHILSIHTSYATLLSDISLKTLRHSEVIVTALTHMYKWVMANLLPGVTTRWTEGVQILLVTSRYRNQDKLWSHRPLAEYADFIFECYTMEYP